MLILSLVVNPHLFSRNRTGGNRENGECGPWATDPVLGTPSIRWLDFGRNWIQIAWLFHLCFLRYLLLVEW